MTDSLFDRCGWNPTEVHARLFGRRPRGIIVVTAEQRARAQREAKERERAEHEAKERDLAERAAKEREHAEAPPPPPPPLELKGEESDPPRDGEGNRTQCGGGDSPPGDTAGEQRSEAVPGRECPPSAAAPLPPPRSGEDDSPPPLMVTPELKAWIERHLDTLNALDAADALPDLGARSPTEPPAPPPPPPPRPPVYVAKGDRWDKHKMANFLRQLAATHSVSAAAKSVGMSRESAHRLRNRLKGQPFDVAWEAASRHGYDALTDAAIDRAINGVEVPHYHNGEVVGTHRKYSDALLIALLKLRNDRGAPQVGRYGAAAEWQSERWDASLERVETGSVDWSDEHRALDEERMADLRLPTEDKLIDALIQKHAPLPDHRSPMRK